MNKFLHTLAVCVVTGGLLVLAPAGAQAAGAPQTIPALREWTGGTGTYTFTATSRIVVNPANAVALADEAQVFAEDLSTQSGRTIAVVNGTPAAGDIYLSLGATGLPAEGYALSIASLISITGIDETGAFYGTRTVLQLLHQAATVSFGSARDWPVKAERGLMIDQGREFFTVDWVKRHIRELAYLKLNYFHFHLSDTFGFRLESTTHPELTSAAHYSKQDIADLVALAARYKITVVPELDFPGHMNTTLAAHPELRLRNSAGTYSNSDIDLSLDASYTLISDLINEYLPLFPAAYWHLGADEYVPNYADYPQLLTYARAHYGASATAKDTYYGFINWANGLVRAGGKTTRMWNDGIKTGDGTIAPATNILVEYWYNYGLTPQQLLDRGHTIANESWDPTYYVLGGSKPNSQWGYETWNADLFQGSNTINAPARNRGSVIHVWCDNPNAETEDQIASGIFYPLRVLAQQTWASPKLVTAYSAFTPIAGAIGHAPGWPVSGSPGNLALNKPVSVSSTETTNFPGAAAVDGDPGTRWASSYVDPSWIQVDLGSSVTLARVVLRWEAAYGRAYKIQLSANGSTWTDVYSTTTGDGGVDDLAISGTGRYLRMYGTQRGSTYGYSLFEFEAYGPSSTVYTVTTGGKALDNPASSGSTGTQMVTWTPHGGANQQWRFTPNADGSFTIANGASGLCLDVNGGSTAPGTKVIQWTCTGGDNQRWLVASGKITSKKSGLSLTTASTSDGALVTQATVTGSPLQRWTLTQI
jgi:hexosaminidase